MPESSGPAPRWPCPVCLGVKMQKAEVFGARAAAVTIDHCARCGGVWFERGEVQQLARHDADALWTHVAKRAEPARTVCHGCRTPLARDAERCAACGRANTIACPQCDRAMERVAREGLTLDVCRNCHGVWFDHAELAAVWRLELDAAVARRRGSVAGGAAVAGDVLLDAMIWTPDLLVYGAYGATRAAAAGIEVIGHAAANAPEMVETVGEAASGLFELIVEIISSIFD